MSASTRPALKRRGRKDGDGSSKWITTYADAVTILMAFFIMLYAMSEIDVMKFTAFLEGLRVPFGNEAGEGLLPETDGLQPDQPPPSPVTGDEYRDLPDDLDPDLTEQQISEMMDEWEARQDDDAGQDAGQLEHHEDQLAEVREALDDALEEEELDLLVEMRREERGLIVSIASDDILFALGSTTINDLGRRVIAVVSETLDDFPNPLLVEGHTDDIPLDRNGYTNWNLSTDRAVAVLQLMIEEHELPSDRVGAVGYSEYHPLDTNETQEGRARNRRVDIVVLVSEESFDGRDVTPEEP